MNEWINEKKNGRTKKRSLQLPKYGATNGGLSSIHERQVCDWQTPFDNIVNLVKAGKELFLFVWLIFNPFWDMLTLYFTLLMKRKLQKWLRAISGKEQHICDGRPTLISLHEQITIQLLSLFFKVVMFVCVCARARVSGWILVYAYVSVDGYMCMCTC